MAVWTDIPEVKGHPLFCELNDQSIHRYHANELMNQPLRTRFRFNVSRFYNITNLQYAVDLQHQLRNVQLRQGDLFYKHTYIDHVIVLSSYPEKGSVLENFHKNVLILKVLGQQFWSLWKNAGVCRKLVDDRTRLKLRCYRFF